MPSLSTTSESWTIMNRQDYENKGVAPEMKSETKVDDDLFPFSEENGDISDVPKEVVSFFKKKGLGKVVTPAFLQEISGSPEIAVEKHNMYVMGKKIRTGSVNRPAYLTKMRIDGKSSQRNSVQGLLGVRFLGGFGYMNNNCSADLRVMRPTNIDKLVTEDSSQFRKRAVIHLNGHVLALSRAEGFCRIPLMDDRVLAKFEKRSNAKKREAYARKKLAGNEWAHINRNAMQEENKKTILGMLVPYKKNLGDEFFREFMKDLIAIGLQLGKEFGTNASIDDLLVNVNINSGTGGTINSGTSGTINRSTSGTRKRGLNDVDPDADLEAQKRVVLQKISQNKWTAVRTVSSSDIKW